MKKFIKNYWLLLIIVMLAFILRVYKIDEFPKGLTWDEPALGYNAYSILKTGRDEYGSLLPITFKSFGDYKPGFFIYYLIPSIALFGLNTFGIRFPSALAGVGTVAAIFFLTKMIFSDRKEKITLAYLASLLLTISPWHINFSRGAWELNLALFFIVIGVMSLLKSIQKINSKRLVTTTVIIAVAFYIYHGTKVFLIPFIVGFLLIYRQNIKEVHPRFQKLGLLLLMLLVIPLLTSFKGSTNRAKIMSVFTYQRSQSDINNILNQEEILPSFNYLLFHSEGLNMIRALSERYFNYFSGKFLFFEGDWQSTRHSIPYMGMIYYIEIPFLFLGLGYLLATKKSNNENLLIWWLLTAPVPAIITRDIIQGGRSLQMVIPLVLITALGLSVFIRWLCRFSKILRISALTVIVLGYFLCFLLFLDLYFVHYPVLNSQGWNYGIEEVVRYIKTNKNKYQKIIMTQRYGQPYIFYLFYTQYPPENYQKQARLTENPWGDIGTVDFLDNIEFRNSYWPEDRDCRNCLIIDYELALNDQDIKNTPWARHIEDIKFLDGKIAYRLVETK